MASSVHSRPQSRLMRSLVAVPAVATALAVTMLAALVVSADPSPVFLAAVMFSAWRGGIAAGLLATFLSSCVRAFFFLPPAYSFTLDPKGVEELAVFGFAALVISSLSAAREDALAREQAARVEAESANAVKDEFLAAVSHELRTPLTTIKTLARLVRRDDTTESEREEYLTDIGSECDRQIDLINNLLDLSSIRAGAVPVTPGRVDAAEVLRDCEKTERFEANERGHDLSVALAEDLPDVRADFGALRRAICTIVDNAIKYTPDGGSIALRARCDGDTRVAIEIVDNGRGIRAEDLPNVFDSFYRGQPVTGDAGHEDSAVPGIGLGLYLARVLVTGMGGTIDVASVEGRGSTFTVRLPVWREEAVAEGAHEPVHEFVSGSREVARGETPSRR